MSFFIRNKNGVQLEFSPVGATWLSCLIPTSDGCRNVLLTCKSVEDNSAAFIGSTVGRYANRIKNAIIYDDHNCYTLEPNQGKHQLHGGRCGFHSITWSIISHQVNRIIFGFQTPNGDQGFPGKVKATVDYLLTDSNQVQINYIATTDKTTPLNLTNHAYFNLEGSGNILDHKIFVDADYYLPVDREGIPTGNLLSVTEEMMDIRELKRIGHGLLESKDRKLLNGYDHAYLLNPLARTFVKPAAKLISGDEKVVMEVFTNKPAIQIYSGNHLNGVKGKHGTFSSYQGIALETEFLPDSPNRPDWPHESSWFTADQFYCYTTSYQFYF